MRNDKPAKISVAHTVLFPPLGVSLERRVNGNDAIVAEKKLPWRSGRERRWCLFLAEQQNQDKKTVSCNGHGYTIPDPERTP
jgi:hypothetical protein